MMPISLLEDRLRILLPENYRDSYEAVEPVPMRSAGLVYREGQVAWDEIWGSFCDLAMAGGPSHRGRLLEAGTPQQVQAQPGRYGDVVTELCRGIHLVTGLFAEPSPTPGWVQVYCTSAVMADWLARAIVMENVSAHRRGVVLNLPAGPDFRLEKEIKNVVTVIAKTTHYWQDHTSDDRQEAVAELVRMLQGEFPLVQPPLAWAPAEQGKRVQLREHLISGVFKATGLQVSDHEYDDWAGFRCPDVRAAIRTMRFLMASNVLARREENSVFVPVAPEGETRLEALIARFREAYTCAVAA